NGIGRRRVVGYVDGEAIGCAIGVEDEVPAKRVRESWHGGDSLDHLTAGSRESRSCYGAARQRTRVSETEKRPVAKHECERRKSDSAAPTLSRPFEKEHYQYRQRYDPEDCNQPPMRQHIAPRTRDNQKRQHGGNRRPDKLQEPCSRG